MHKDSQSGQAKGLAPVIGRPIRTGSKQLVQVAIDLDCLTTYPCLSCTNLKLDDSDTFTHHLLHDTRLRQSIMAYDPDRGLSGWGIFFLVAFILIVIGGVAWIL